MTAYLLSISIVLYNDNAAIFEKNIQHLVTATQKLPGASKLFVVDNNPERQDRSWILEILKKFSELDSELILSQSNQGYGAGNNLAIAKADSKYHLVLNPDAFVEPFSLLHAVNYMEQHSQVGLLCPAIFGVEGERHFVHRKHPTFIDLCLRSFAPGIIKKIFKKRMLAFELQHLDWDQEQNIPSPSGCCMLFRTVLLQQLHGFAPEFFLYYEDSDIGRRIGQLAQVKYLPNFRVIHLWKREGHKSWHYKWHLIKSGFIYLWKWRSTK